MTLPSDELIRKAFNTAPTNVADWASLIPKIWAAQIETNLRKQACFQESIIQNTDLLVPGAGDTVYIPILPDLDAVPAVAEANPLSIYAMNNASSVPLTPSEYGLSIEVTRKMLDRIKYDGIAAIVDRMSYSMTKTLEGQISTLGSSGAVVPGGGGAALTQLYQNGHTSSTIVAADVFSDNSILSGVTYLRQQNNHTFPDGYYRLYISPSQYQSLIQDTQIRQDLRYAAPASLLNGEVGALHGCRIVVTNWIPTTAEGSGGTVTAYNAMLLAPRWAAVSWKRQPSIVVDPTLYDMGRRRRFGITADFDIELLHAERAVVLKSA